MAAPWHDGRLVRIEPVTDILWRFWLEVEGVKSFDFQPGQFVTLDLPIGEKPKERWRSYSIASAPDGTNLIELIIVLLEGGRGTNYLFHEAKVGTSIRLMGPLGKFTLPDPFERDLCLICTGTGIAPFRSMLHWMAANPADRPPTTLIFGSRYQQDIPYREEMEALAEKLPGFEYHVTLSRDSDPNWKGHRGYVHQVYEELYADKRPADFYLCGWRMMIDEARERLDKMGYPRSSIHLEIYG